MSEITNFASFGGDVKVHTINGNKICSEYSKSFKIESPYNENVRLSWGDKYLIGPPNQNYLSIYKTDASKGSISKFIHIPDVDISVATFFNKTNLNLVAGYKNGAVKVWNVKQKKIVKTLCSEATQSVKFAEVSTDDNYVAAAGSYSSKPKIQVYGLQTNKELSSLMFENPGEISDVRFSSLKKNYLAACTLEGTVMVWDLFNNAAIMSKDCSVLGACTGVCLSPVNQNVLATVTLGATVTVYDLRQKQSVFQTVLGSRLTAVDIVDGLPSAMVFGSRDGRLLLFDLRNSETLDDIQAHTGAVTSVRGAPVVKKNATTAISTPDADPVVVEHPETPEVENSVSDMFTPPIQRLQKSGVLERDHSTPNNMRSSFFDLISPACSAGAPSPLPFELRPSPLILPNRLDKSVIPSPSPIPKATPAAQVTMEAHPSPASTVLVNGSPPAEMTRDMSEVRRELDELKTENSKLLQEVKDVKNEVSGLRSDLSEVLRLLKGSVVSEVEDINGQLAELRGGVDRLYYEVRMDNVLSDLFNGVHT